MKKGFYRVVRSTSLWQTLLFSFLSLLTAAQSIQTGRYELEQKNNDQEFILVSMQAEGIALIRDMEKYKDGKQQWQLIRVDTTLQEVWSMELDIENRLRIVGYEYKDNLIYLLFRTGENEASELTLFTIHIGSQDVRRYTIKLELSFKVTHFSALANSIALGGYVSNEPAILLYDTENEKTKIVPGFFVSDTELLDLRVNSNNTLNTVITDQSNKQKKKLLLKTFDTSGALLLEDIIEIDENRTILSCMTSTLINDELLLVGTWTVGTSKLASGIYSTLIDPFTDQPINYYDFGQLQHFLDFQKEKRIATLKERSMTANKLGEIPDFKTYAIPMRLEEQPTGFALLTEVYLPSTSLNTNPYWNNNYGIPYAGYSPYGYNPFMNRYYNTPYQFNNPQTGETKMLHASLSLFDLQGKLLSDYGLKLEDKKAAGLEQTSDFVFYGDHIALAYKKEKELIINNAQPDGVIIPETLVTQLEETAIVRQDSNNNSLIRAWYKNIFFVSGYQNIKDKSGKTEDPTRFVFYINKIEIH